MKKFEALRKAIVEYDGDNFKDTKMPKCPHCGEEMSDEESYKYGELFTDDTYIDVECRDCNLEYRIYTVSRDYAYTTNFLEE